MSMTDRTNETISLSQHAPLDEEPAFHAAELYVDHDFDSSFDPAEWVAISLTDSAHDSDTIKLTHEEAGLLHDRLGLILGRPQGGLSSAECEEIDALARVEASSINDWAEGRFAADETAHGVDDDSFAAGAGWAILRCRAAAEPSEEQIDMLQEALYDDHRDGDREPIRRALRAAGLVAGGAR